MTAGTAVAAREILAQAEVLLPAAAEALVTLDALFSVAPNPDDEGVPSLRREKEQHRHAIDRTRSGVHSTSQAVAGERTRLSAVVVAHERLSELCARLGDDDFAAKWLRGDIDMPATETTEIAVLRACLRHGVADPGRIERLSSLRRLLDDGSADLGRAVERLRGALASAESLRA